MRFFGSLEIKGLHNLDEVKTNVIFACNHSNEFDPFMVPGPLPFMSRFSPIFYASREKGFYSKCGWRQVFYGGFLFRMWGAFPVFIGLNDYEKSLVQHIRILNDGGNDVVYPEGGTTRDGRLQPAKGGVAYLAERTGKPIVPVAIIGTFQLSPGVFISRRRKLKVIFGKPIYADEMKSHAQTLEKKESFAHYKEMSEYVMKRIGEMLDVETK